MDLFVGTSTSLPDANDDIGAINSHSIVLSPLPEPWADFRQSRAERNKQLEIAIVDDRPLIQDCFGRVLEATVPNLSLQYFSDVEELRNARLENADCVGIVLMCTIWSPTRSEICFEQIASLKADMPTINTILLSDIDKIDDVVKLIECGARGYIPTSISLDVAVRAIQLVAAGGVYVPASILFWADRIAKQASHSDSKSQQTSLFTSRQMSVIEALRRGKPNKIIAYDLNMCESTVKVHIRNIMKRMKARNRTEVAYMLNNMLSDNKLLL